MVKEVTPHSEIPRHFRAVIDSGLAGRGAARAEDAQGTPTQSHISPSILVYEDYHEEHAGAGVGWDQPVGFRFCSLPGIPFPGIYQELSVQDSYEEIQMIVSGR